MKNTTPLRRAAAIFGISENNEKFRQIAKQRQNKGFKVDELVDFGRRFGFFKRPARPLCVSVFVTKGGVLKTSLTLNLARTAALHGLKVCVVGLDMQADITTALLPEAATEDKASLVEALAQANELRGLADVFSDECELSDVILETEIPNLHVIPETPELVALDQSLMSRNRREYWLKENVVTPLEKIYDLILLDCSPNWNRLITNALVASDVLISPVECRVTNFRNLKIFRGLISEFRKEMRLNFDHWYVATRLSTQRRLSAEIYEWYKSNLATRETVILQTPIRETLVGEEATAMRLSLLEYVPGHAAAEEMRELMNEIHSRLKKTASERVLSQEVEYVSRTR